MHRLRLAVAVTASALAVTASAVAPALATTTPHATSGTEYYLSLGDSLSQGVQPNLSGQSVPTNQGFTDQLYAMLATADPSLRVHKLGCPGETTTTLLKGGICGYKGPNLYSFTADVGSQIAAAVAFLKAHPGHVPLITIVIGANDVLPCAAQGTLPRILACLKKVLPVVQKNLTTALTRLRAADPSGRIVGMTYYDPLLAEWLTGSAGRTFAKESITFAATFRSLLMGVYQAFHAGVADVYTAFNTADITDMVTLPGIGTVPEDVGLICEQTWMCIPAPRGPNIHANIIGYRVIAETFLATLHR
jgi:lysophospholipase L1-like esterase